MSSSLLRLFNTTGVGADGALAAPANLALSITGAGFDVITAAWDAVGGAATYEVEYSDDGVTYAPVDTTALLTYGVTGADYDVDAAIHYVRVRAVGGEDWASANIDGWKVNTGFYANLDEASGNRATQVSGLTLTDNNTVGSAAGIIGNAASFTRANSEYLSVADNAALNIGGGDFTVRTWIRPTTEMESYAALLGKWTAGAREWLLQIDDSTRVFFGVWDSGNSLAGSAVTAGGTIGPNNTYHIVATRIGAALAIYLNGTESATGTITGTPRTSSAAAFAIGATADVAELTRFDGWQDEIAICKGRAWSAAQITHDWNSGAGRTY